jgi:hypothetical protein
VILFLKTKKRVSVSPVQFFMDMIYYSVLARKTAAQHQDNRRAFVTTNGCFSSKATKDPRFRGGETTAFQRKTVKINQILGLLGIGGENKVERNVDAKSNNDKRVICFCRSIVLFVNRSGPLNRHRTLRYTRQVMYTNKLSEAKANRIFLA